MKQIIHTHAPKLPHSIDIVELFLPIAVGILLFLTTASLFVMRFAGSTQLTRQVLTWWRIWPCAVLALTWFPLGWYALLGVLLGFGARELPVLVKVDRQQKPIASAGSMWLTIGVALAVSCAVTSVLAVVAPAVHASLFMVSLLLFVGCSMWSPRPLLCAAIWLSIGLTSLGQFHLLEPSLALRWLGFLLVITAFNDVAQYLVGKPFGRHRIAPRLSPNKTWQGLAGGTLISALLAFWIGQQLQLAPAVPLLLLGGALAVGGFVGDLAFSALKRQAGIKDFSNLLPGHGGMLDRIDSLMFTAPLLWLLVYFQWI